MAPFSRMVLLAAAVLSLSSGVVLQRPARASAATELLTNAGLEAAGTGGLPAYWQPSSWGTHTAAFGWSTDAHTGTHSVRVDVSAYTDGDSKWVPDDAHLVPVTGGTYYRFSDWYKATASTAVSVYYETAADAPGEGRWANLFAGIAPAAAWTQYRTGFTMPSGAVRAYFAHFIAGNGSLQTDDYSMTAAPAPPGFGRPLISLTFDDGSEGFHQTALGLLDAKGFKTTQYIPTAGLVTSPPDPFMMTTAQLGDMARDGHEIGAHSVTHPDLTTIGDAALAAELQDPKTLLQAIPGVGTVSDFAYPFGSYDARVIAATQAAGYQTARSVEEGYNTKGDLEPYDLRGQNMTSTTTLAQFRSWVDYAEAHNYWLVVIYHEVVPDSAPVCTDPATVDPCLGPYDTRAGLFQQQLDYLSASGAGRDVMTVRDALARTGAVVLPLAGTVQITPSLPATTAVLTATTSGFHDPDGDALTYHYRWLVDGVTVTGATGPTLDLAAAGHGDHGDVVAVQVSADDGHGHSTATAQATTTVVNTPPGAGSVALDPPAPAAGTALTATPGGFADADADALGYSYAWFRNGQAIAGQSSATLPATGSPGDVITVEVRATDGHGGTSVPATAAATLGAATLGAAAEVTGTTVAPPRTGDRTAPRIRITSPTPRTYRLGWKVTIRFTCTDSSGAVSTRVTLRRVGSATRRVHQGTRVRLSHTGTYVLRITATDRAGNAATRTVRFHVRRR
ncbi:polysaccharide deacetylase family protein [Baekduia soli]|uniref:Polysaccharide deacetylase family protein n=1 Tax=Baekduia soli TaxID=496014 RepID=A0A5B8TZP1_9ACTN|nr:polysaccharide deacetylase family protein [Baekduia soli]QEC46193.1 polysaccharide deacetylase family protein [Baekduia soli]